MGQVDLSRRLFQKRCKTGVCASSFIIIIIIIALFVGVIGLVGLVLLPEAAKQSLNEGSEHEEPVRAFHIYIYAGGKQVGKIFQRLFWAKFSEAILGELERAHRNLGWGFLKTRVLRGEISSVGLW